MLILIWSFNTKPLCRIGLHRNKLQQKENRKFKIILVDFFSFQLNKKILGFKKNYFNIFWDWKDINCVMLKWVFIYSCKNNYKITTL